MMKINYLLGPEARKIFAKATGSLDLKDAPALIALDLSGFIPQKGDCLRWDAVSKDVIFVVDNRLIRFGVEGDVVIDLLIDCQS